MKRPSSISPAVIRVGSMLLLAVTVGVAAAAKRPEAKVVRHVAGCDFTPSADEQPIELPKEVNKLPAGCIDEIASYQNEGVVTIQTDVPVDPTTCPSGVKTTTVRSIGYEGIGQTNPSDYGVGNAKKRGYVVAKIRNDGACATAAPISIPARTTVFWVVEYKDGANTASARLLVAGGKGDMNGQKKFRFHSCGNSDEPEDDKAWFKYGGACTDKLHSVSSLAASRRRAIALKLTFPPSKHRRLDDPPPILWMACGGDCCVTDQ